MKSEETLFAAAIELPLAEREKFIERECGSDEGLKNRLRKLLRSHDQTNSLLDPQKPEADQTPTENVEGQFIGKYRLLQKIGEGGFGAVYMAEQREPVQRTVALKIIKPGMDTDSVIARFEAERQALAMMEHPNIARVFDGGTIETSNILGGGPRPYFVMELVKGVPVTEYCDRNSLSTRDRLRLFIDICKAVQHAHQKGIIHRDLKPSNVMVTLHDGEPVVKVIDFGVAKAIHHRLTEKTMFTEYGQMIGTPQYMSPEQAEMSGLDVDTRSDVYSLAVLLYELLTGTTPLQANSLRKAGYAEMQKLIRDQEPEKPSLRLSSVGDNLTVIAKHRSVSPDRLSREVRGDLDWIVMKGLEKDRRRRYESPINFARDIERALNDQPVEAGPPSFSYRLKKFTWRHRKKLALAAAGLILLLSIGGWSAMNTKAWLDRQNRESNQLSQAVFNAENLLELAARNSSGNTEEWLAAQSAHQRVKDLMDGTIAKSDVQESAKTFFEQFAQADQNRQFARDVENLLINRATSMDLPSWTRMESEFREIFKKRGLDLDKMDPATVGETIRDSNDQVQLADALELWMGTRGQMATFGGPRLTKEIMQPWTEAIYVADPDPLRTGIRRVVYQADPATTEHLDELVERCDLTEAMPRTLSWLAITYQMARNPKRSNEIHLMSLKQHPDDLMLNFDFALTLSAQKDWNRAIRYYMRCTALRPELPGIWRGLGNCYRENGELELSRDSLEYAVKLQPDHGPGYLDLAETCLAQNDFESTISWAEKALQQKVDAVKALSLVGNANMELERYAEALVAFEKCHDLATEQKRSKSKFPTEEWLKNCREKIAEKE